MYPPISWGSIRSDLELKLQGIVILFFPKSCCPMLAIVTERRFIKPEWGGQGAFDSFA